jgi:acyl-CoA synthetase (AMP-forming)/AMP-acid ligase II
VDSATALLAEGGIDERSVVGLTVADEAQHLVLTAALFALGAKQTTLASHDTEAVRAELAARVGVTDVVASRGEHRLPGVRFVAAGDDPRFGGRRLRGGPPNAPGGVLYLKTSGTTGAMNVVAFDETELALQAQRHANYADERFLRLAPIEHNNSKRHRLYCLFAGGTGMFLGDAAVSVPEFCRRHEVTCVDVSRFHAANLLYGERPAGRRVLDGIKLRMGGMAVPGKLRRRIEDTITRELYVRYAATECGAISMAGPGEHDDTDPVGRPLDGVTVEVVGPDGAPRPPGEIGEIRLRAPGMATSYVGDPDATARRFRDGRFHPGDSGEIRKDGVLVVHGRVDDMILLNGLNIYPAEIERVLERHPAVRSAAAMPFASDVHGQIPVAAVELHDGAAATADELRGWARERLALRAPRRVMVMAALPRTPQGKIAKAMIVAAMRETRVR